MLGLAAAVFGTPFALGVAKPVVGLLARGGIKATGLAARKLGVGRSVGLGIAAAGLGASSIAHSDFVEQYHVGVHGTSEESMAALQSIRTAGTLLGGAALLGGGAAVIGRMPGVGLMKRGAKGAMKRMRPAGYWHMPVKRDRNIAKRIAGRASTSLAWAVKHPGTMAFTAGSIAGAGAATISNSHMYKGRDGTIRAINSAPQGGISPELQFSTQGLTLALHRAARR